MKLSKKFGSKTTTIAAAAAILAVAGGGAGYAAATIGSADVVDNSLRSIDVQDGTLQAADLTPTLLSFVRGQRVISAVGAGTPFNATNNSVSLTADGVEFGPYADGGASGGTFCYTGLSGQKLSAINSLSYTARVTTQGNANGYATPYLRIFLGDNGAADPGSSFTNDAIFSANTQLPDPITTEGTFETYAASAGQWRYDDDGGEQTTSGGLGFADLVAGHANEVIGDLGICITGGFNGGGTNVNVLLRDLEINGTTMQFRGTTRSNNGTVTPTPAPAG